MFLSIMALFRFLIPWQRIWGFTYSLRMKNSNPSNAENSGEKEFLDFQL